MGAVAMIAAFVIGFGVLGAALTATWPLTQTSHNTTLPPGLTGCHSPVARIFGYGASFIVYGCGGLVPAIHVTITGNYTPTVSLVNLTDLWLANTTGYGANATGCSSLPGALNITGSPTLALTFRSSFDYCADYGNGGFGQIGNFTVAWN
jgi:hypothetical protein